MGFFLYKISMELQTVALHNLYFFEYRDNFMWRVWMLASVVAMTGCTTTSNLVNKAKGVVTSESSTPLEQVFKTQPNLESALNSVQIQQVFNKVETPTAAKITVLESQLLDDSVSAIRTTYSFKLVENDWTLVDKKEVYKCARGENTTNFQAALCS